MNLKTFRGNSMAEALSEVKKDLGRDAVILHTRTIRVGGVLGVGKRSIVEITASDQEPGPPRTRPRPRVPTTRLPATAPAPMPLSIQPQVMAHANTSSPAASPARHAPPPAPAQAPSNTQSDEFIAGMPWASVFEQQPTRSQPQVPPPQPPAPQPFDESRPRPVSIDLNTPDSIEASAPRSQPPAQPTAPVTPQASPPVQRNTAPTVRLPAELTAGMEGELSQIKAMLGQVLRSTRSGLAGVGVLPEPLLEIYTALLDQEVPDAIAESIIGQACNELTPDELEAPEIVRATVLRLIASRIRVSDSWPPRREAERPSVIALVGPTGVGKTTTLAKLAAGLKLKRGLRVGLVTCDTYRIAAVEQLRTYAEIIGVPLRVALSPSELRDGIDVMSDCDVVLVDTAGRSQHDAERIAELRALTEAAKPDQTHLVLSAASSQGVLRRACDNFTPLSPDRLLLTKIDEAVGLGPLLEILERTHLPMSFISTGQEVPDHIERACSERIARRILPISKPGPAASSKLTLTSDTVGSVA